MDLSTEQVPYSPFLTGHETTSGLLSFAFLNLLKNSSTYLRAQKEVDEVVGKQSVQVHHLKNLKYLNAVLRETLRLFPTAPAMTKKVNPAVAHEPAILGGKYKVEPHEAIMVLFGKAQQDPAVYGDDAAEFKPERMLDEEFDKLPKGAWSVRGCIYCPASQSMLIHTAFWEWSQSLHRSCLRMAGGANGDRDDSSKL